jgi:hypothetical protein
MIRILLTFLLVLTLSCTANSGEALRFPGPSHGALSDKGETDDAPNGLGEICYWVNAVRRTPIYAQPSTAGKVLYYLPRLTTTVCLLGISDGWGVFSWMADPHKATIKETLDDELDGHYAWVQVKDLSPFTGHCKDYRSKPLPKGYEYPAGEAAKRIKKKEMLMTLICPEHLSNVKGGTVLVVFDDKRLEGSTYKTISPSPLTSCIASCRDDSQCKGFLYNIGGSTCLLRDSFFHVPLWDNKPFVEYPDVKGFLGVKLIK